MGKIIEACTTKDGKVDFKKVERCMMVMKITKTFFKLCFIGVILWIIIKVLFIL